MQRPGVTVIEDALQRERQPYQSIAVRPLSALIGAEVEGLDLRRKPSAAELAELRRAFLEHHVLTFRDQLLSQADHVRVAALFGFEPEGECLPCAAPLTELAAPHHPIAAGRWRADKTYLRAPPAGGALHVDTLPSAGVGGDMVFANMQLAFALLAEPLRALLLGLTAIHAPDPEAPVDTADETAEHPVVIRHPVTGRAALYVNRRHASRILQLSAHSQPTLEMLFRHLETHPILTCRIRWTPNTLVVWDNSCTQHLTLQDFEPGRLSGQLVWFRGDPPAAYGST